MRSARDLGVPTPVVKTRSWSFQSPASLILSSSCDLRCLFSEERANSGSLMLRRLLDVFGAPNLIPPPVAVESIRRTWRVPASKSMSSHSRPRSSPCRIPVVRTSAYRASSHSPRAASSRIRACTWLRGFISFFTGREAVTASVTLRGMRARRPRPVSAPSGGWCGRVAPCGARARLPTALGTSRARGRELACRA
jgi:hypothetical protein